MSGGSNGYVWAVSHLHAISGDMEIFQAPGIDKAKAYLESVVYFMRHGDAIEVRFYGECTVVYFLGQYVLWGSVMLASLLPLLLS